MKKMSDNTGPVARGSVRRWRTTVPVAVVAASVLLAACGSSGSPAASGSTSPTTSSPTTSSPTTSSPSPAPATTSTSGSAGDSGGGCPTASQVDTAMGGTFTLQSSGPFGGGVQCAYISGSRKLDVDVDANSEESTLPAALSSVGTKVSGLGKWAFWEPLADTFEAYKGSTFVAIVWATIGGTEPPESSFVSLARQIL
jgi:hypothetical protein